MADGVEKLAGLFTPVLNAMGLQLWGIEYLPRGRHAVLRIYVDKETGVDVEDCARASRQISGILDVEDPISGSYTLEVSSPGLDRPLFFLDQYREYAGHAVKLRIKGGFENKRNFSGRIKAVRDGKVVLDVNDEELELPFEWIDKANIVSKV